MVFCKYPDKPCKDRYTSHSERKAGLHCRLREWKRRIKTCPYDHRIVSGHARKRRKDKCQRQLM